MSAFTLHIHQHLAVLALGTAAQPGVLTAGSALAIADAVERLSQQPEIKALAVTGSAGVFCAGADLQQLLAARDGDGTELQHIYRAFTSVAQSPLLTLALVNGPAPGAGMNLAMACDIRLATPDAWFESRFFQLALHPGGGHCWLLPQLIGWQQAAAMILAGERLTAQQALASGFVKELVAEASLLARAQQLVAPLADVPAELVRQTKNSMLQLRACRTLDDAVAYEFRQQFQSLQSEAAGRQIAALLSRIKPT